MKIMKIKYLFFAFVLVSALPGFAADPVSPSDGSETNVVVLTQEQYAALTNDMARLVSSFSNVVYLLEFSVDGSVTSTNLLGSAASSLSEIRQRIQTLTTSILKQKFFTLQSDGSLKLSSGTASSFSAWFWNVNNNLVGLGNLLHAFISGSADGSYDASYYNFMTLIDGLSDLLDAIDSLHRLLREHLTQIQSDLSVSRSYIESIRDFLVSQLPYMTSIMQGGTNQLQTIIYIVEDLTNRVDATETNFYGDVTNALNSIAAGVHSIDLAIGDGWEPGGGSWPPGGGSGSGFPSNLVKYVKKWSRDWVDRYYYPADSTFSLELKYGSLQDKYNNIGGSHFSFKVPYLGLEIAAHPEWGDLSPAAYLDSPAWWSAFANTTAAYNGGHTNYYDIVSALLTDIQSVNAQNYALFYVLATNILLQSADVDVEETKQDVNALQEKIDSYQSDVETLKTDLEYKFNSLKNKYEDIKEKSDHIFSYLGGLARLPTTDYYFDLPKLQLGEDLEFGGMEIILPLTNQHLVMVAEILRFFSICLYWGLFISMLYFAARGVVRMFLLLFKFMLYMGAIGTDK